MNLPEIFAVLLIVWGVAAICRSAWDNLRLQGARLVRLNRRQLVDEVLRSAHDPEACRAKIESLTERLARRPGDEGAWLQRGLYSQVLLQLESASTDFSRALEFSPEDPYLLLTRGQILIALGQVDAGLADLDFALSVSPDYADCLALRATTLCFVGRRDIADQDLKRLLTYPLRGAESLLSRAQLRLSIRSDYEGAVSDATAALTLPPSNPHGLYVRGFCQDVLGRLENATQDFRDLAALAPTSPFATALRGYAYAWLGHDEAARRDFVTARESELESISMRRLLAGLSLNLGEMEQSLVDFNIIITSGDVTAADFLDRATILADRGNYLDALADYRRAMEIHPGDGLPCNNLAWFLATCPDAAIRNGPEASRLARRAVELLPVATSWAYGTLAAAQAECGEFAEAVESEETAWSLSQGDERRDWAFLLDLYRSAQPYRAPLHDTRERSRKRRAVVVG